MSIVKALRVVQDAYGWLPPDALLALADRLNVRPYRLQEVASCFPHFHRDKPPPVKLRVCRDMACHLSGAPELLCRLEKLSQADGKRLFEVDGVSCLGRCDRAPIVCVEKSTIPAQPPDVVLTAARAALTTDDGPPHFDFWSMKGIPCDSERLRGLVSPFTDAAATVQFDDDESFPTARNAWLIDVYESKPYSPYEAARKFANELLREGALVLRSDRPTPRAERPTQTRKYEKDLKDFLESSYPAGVCHLLERLSDASLRGMGGAQTPAFTKMLDVLTAPGDICYVVANGDESEPGTFKDRELLVRSPHLVVEGVILAGLLLGAERGYIYVRHEYAEGISKLRAAINEAERVGVCGASVLGTARAFPVEVFISPGGYICGEQSALIEALEGKRAEPRNRPPELATNGLYDRPTLVNNVETLAWLPAIVLQEVEAKQGPEGEKVSKSWYARLGAKPCAGRRLFSICGDVARPGVYELPVGAPLRELVMECAGGMRDSTHPFKAIAPSGPSGGFLPERFTDCNGNERQVLDMPLDIDVFRKVELILGAGLVVYDDTRNMAEQAVNCTEFYRNETCGKCVPCRIGSEKLVHIGKLLRTPLDVTTRKNQEGIVTELKEAMTYASICSLGTSAPAPLATALEYFHDDFESRTQATCSDSVSAGSA